VAGPTRLQFMVKGSAVARRQHKEHGPTSPTASILPAILFPSTQCEIVRIWMAGMPGKLNQARCPKLKVLRRRQMKKTRDEGLLAVGQAVSGNPRCHHALATAGQKERRRPFP